MPPRSRGNVNVVDGSARIYGRSMAGGPGRGLSSATTRVAVVGWHGDGWWACWVGDTGRDLRRVGVRGGESVGGRAAECALMWRAASSEWRVRAVLEHGRLPQGMGPAEGRAVVMGCDEPLARGGGARRDGWRGLVWCKSGLPAGISGCAGLLLVGWRAARLSHACHKWGETWWDAGRYVETVSAGRREGRDGLGRVNMVSR